MQCGQDASNDVQELLNQGVEEGTEKCVRLKYLSALIEAYEVEHLLPMDGGTPQSIVESMLDQDPIWRFPQFERSL
jgi:antitoxin component HigA of HigAB toxin-antitoxin module